MRDKDTKAAVFSLAIDQQLKRGGTTKSSMSSKTEAV